MALELPASEFLHQLLQRLLRQNPQVEMNYVDLQRSDWATQFNWQGIDTEKADLLPVLQSYQRLSRLTAKIEPNTIFTLMEENLYSAIDIAALPRRQFIRRFAPRFAGGRETAEAVYQNAVAVRARVLCKYLVLKQSREPHVKPTKPNQGEGTI